MSKHGSTLDQKVCKRLREIRDLMHRRMLAVASGKALDKRSDRRAHQAAMFLREVRSFLDGKTTTINFHPERLTTPVRKTRRTRNSLRRAVSR